MTPEEFRAARARLGLTQFAMARLLGFSHLSRISEMENGKTNISASVERLLRAYLDGYRPGDWPE